MQGPQVVIAAVQNVQQHKEGTAKRRRVHNLLDVAVLILGSQKLRALHSCIQGFDGRSRDLKPTEATPSMVAMRLGTEQRPKLTMPVPSASRTPSGTLWAAITFPCTGSSENSGLFSSLSSLEASCGVCAAAQQLNCLYAASSDAASSILFHVDQCSQQSFLHGRLLRGRSIFSSLCNLLKLIDSLGNSHRSSRQKPHMLVEVTGNPDLGS